MKDAAGRVPRWGRWALPPAIFVAVLAAFAPALGAGFLDFDDDRGITGNPSFRGLDAEHLEWMFTTSWMGPYQPLAWLSLAVDHAVYGLTAPGFPEAPGWHATSVLLHALGAVAFYALALRVIGRAAPEGEGGTRALAAALAALFFAVHPLRVESVVWVTERRDVLAGLFAILSALCWTRALERAETARPGAVRTALAWGAAGAAVLLFLASVDRSDPARLGLIGPGRAGLLLAVAALAASAAASSRSVAYHLSLALLLFALLSKGLAVVLPAAFCVLDAQPFGRRPSLRLVLEKAPFWALAAVFSVLAVWGQSGIVGAVSSLADHGPLERVLQSFYGLAYYPARTLVPLGLAPIYELPGEIGLARPFLAPLFAVPALAAALFLLRGRWPGGLPAFVAFALLIAPVLGLFQRGPQLVADRYSYLACMPFALLAGGLVARKRPAVALGCAAAWLVLGGSLTRTYAAAWQSSSSLWEHAVAVNPESPMSRMSLAVALARRAERERDPERRRALLDEAAGHLERAREQSDDPRVLGNLSRVRGQQARLDPEARTERLAESLELARAALARATERDVLQPEYRLAYGLALLAAGRTDEALPHLEWAVSVAPDDIDARLALGSALSGAGRPAEALPHLRRAARLAPASVRAQRRLAEVHEALGNRREALRAWRAVLALAPGHARARARIAELGGASADG